jgi:hypothetical protein
MSPSKVDSKVDGQFGPDIILSNSREATHQLHEPTWHMPSSDGNKDLYLVLWAEWFFQHLRLLLEQLGQ